MSNWLEIVVKWPFVSHKFWWSVSKWKLLGSTQTFARAEKFEFWSVQSNKYLQHIYDWTAKDFNLNLLLNFRRCECNLYRHYWLYQLVGRNKSVRKDEFLYLFKASVWFVASRILIPIWPNSLKFGFLWYYFKYWPKMDHCCFSVSHLQYLSEKILGSRRERILFWNGVTF